MPKINENKRSGLVYMCDYCGKGNFVAKNKEVFEEGLACPDCGVILLPIDCVLIGFLLEGEMYYYRGNKIVHENQVAQEEKNMVHGGPI